ncbi:MAG TPA: hypothetical protein VGO89_06135, partial [Streptomyces sp.]|nr:hypothetical protein [Streptomyces sp.]
MEMLSRLRRRRGFRWAAAAVLLSAVVGFLPAGGPAHAAADRKPVLGAHYDSAASGITFRVHSEGATRMLVELYDKATGAGEKGRLLLKEEGDSGDWTATVSASELREKYGIEGTVYYGYRAW